MLPLWFIVNTFNVCKWTSLPRYILSVPILKPPPYTRNEFIANWEECFVEYTAAIFTVWILLNRVEFIDQCWNTIHSSYDSPILYWDHSSADQSFTGLNSNFFSISVSSQKRILSFGCQAVCLFSVTGNWHLKGWYHRSEICRGSGYLSALWYKSCTYSSCKNIPVQQQRGLWFLQTFMRKKK